MSYSPGLFVGIDLATRIERAERSLLEEAARSVATRADQVVISEIDSGRALWVGPGSPLNKVVGVLGNDFPDALLDEVENAFAERNSAVNFEVSTLADPELVTRLTRRGYALVGFENVLGLRLDGQSRPRAAGVEVADVASDGLESWLDVVADGFGAPDIRGVAAHEEHSRDAARSAISDTSAASGFVPSLATIDGVPAGGAIRRLYEGIAQFSGASTLPEFRRRGVQGTLLAHRIDAATAAGCDLAVVVTLPGSTSQQNVQKLGFQLLYVRAVLVREVETIR
ncbi:GNAT family N-acetyltransferase [Nocardia panacis]|uniref:GNAT family N-acetyltransferase n=1 Tax=Nocardia panacis TaxID=2340916 RepID=A0A3A4KBA0_9NOCA|nr:GNAT family N-acetyltransferase [Nocardia panacis]RJO77150.1 GNAT family N-acetyltransferase [Nocardia panacis]